MYYLSDSDSETESDSNLKQTVQKVRTNQNPVRGTKFLPTHMSPTKVTHKPSEKQPQKGGHPPHMCPHDSKKYHLKT